MEEASSVLRVTGKQLLIFNLLAKEGLGKCAAGAEAEALSSFSLSLAGVSYRPVQVKGCFPPVCALCWATPVHLTHCELIACSWLERWGMGVSGSGLATQTLPLIGQPPVSELWRPQLGTEQPGCRNVSYLHLQGSTTEPDSTSVGPFGPRLQGSSRSSSVPPPGMWQWANL